MTSSRSADERPGEGGVTNCEGRPVTPAQAEALQVEMWWRLSLEERFRIVAAMIEDGFALVAASIRAVHPEYSPEEFRADLAKRIYGDDIAGKLKSTKGNRQVCLLVVRLFGPSEAS
jgi:hypothetical protein